jgi:hypothetical protein
MPESLPSIPEHRGDHMLELRDHQLHVRHADGSPAAVICLRSLRECYHERYRDGTFREALYCTLHQPWLPLPLNMESDELAEQLRANHTYGCTRTDDGDDD